MSIRISFRTLVAALALACCLAPTTQAMAKIKVVASLTDLGSIAAAVGGDQVEVKTIARPQSDPHHVEVLPSYMVRVSKARLYLKVGLMLDQWADQIIDGSRNNKVEILDCSAHIIPLEVPTTRVDGRQGDVHPNGNPHYWMDPRNGGIVARDIAAALGRIDPAHEVEFRQRAETFAKSCEDSRAQAAARIAALPNRTMITYHASWVYFAEAVALEVPGHVEPVPGIPPTGGHLQELVDLIRQRQIPVLLQEPYYSQDAPDFLARQTHIRVIKASPSCDSALPDSYLGHFNKLIAQIAGS